MASALRSGSMSEAFSGQTTRSGVGARPASTSSAPASVAATWLSSTARRSALKSSPACGTLPWTPRNWAVGPSVGSGMASPASPSTSAAATGSAAERDGIRRGPAIAGSPRARARQTPLGREREQRPDEGEDEADEGRTTERDEAAERVSRPG